jgi:hypothetical protein
MRKNCISNVINIMYSSPKFKFIFIGFKKAYDSVRREVLYSIRIAFGIPMKLVRLTKMCLSGTYSKYCNWSSA